MLEVELKASLVNLSTDQIRDSAEKIGFQVKKRLREIDMYFNGNERDFRTPMKLCDCEAAKISPMEGLPRFSSLTKVPNRIKSLVLEPNLKLL